MALLLSELYPLKSFLCEHQHSIVKRDFRGLLHLARIFVKVSVSLVLLLFNCRPKFHQLTGNLLVGLLQHIDQCSG